MISVRGFLVPDRVWFVGPYPPPATPEEVCRSIPPMMVLKDGRSGSVMPAFSDEDLARRYATELMKLGGEFRPLSWSGSRDLAIALAFFAELGETHIVFDPERGINNGRLFTILEVMNAVAESG